MKNLLKKSVLLNLLFLIVTSTFLSFCSGTSPQTVTNTFEINEKNTNYDITFYHIYLDIDIDNQYYEGKVICKFKALQQSNTIVLDLVSRLKVTKIESSLGDISFSQKNDKLYVIFPKKLSLNHIQTIMVYYEGKPQTITEGGITKGMVFSNHGNKEPVIATLSTPFLAHYWFPCNDNVADKADSIYIDIIIPDTKVNNHQLMAVSNGKLISELSLSNNRRIFKWRHRYPIAPCYAFFAVSNYKKHSESISLSNNDELSIDYYLFEEDFEASRASMSKITEVAQFFNDKFGNYPFQEEQMAFAQIGFYSGIETQTCPIVENFTDRRFYTMIHELAHAWFANAVTVENWQHAWLHEGFATYAEVLWDEYTKGKNIYRYSIQKRAYYQGGKVVGEPTDNPFRVFSGIVYNKGAYVLHMLRGVVGDKVFFDILKTYLSKYQYKNVSTEDFITICEEKSGQELAYFFNQWLHEEGYPIYNYSFFQNPRNNEVECSIRQSQTVEYNTLFKMPITLLLDFEYRDTVVTIMNSTLMDKFKFQTDQKLLNIILDPYDWILKDVAIKKQVLEVNNGSIYNVEFDHSLSGRNIEIMIKSATKQKANFMLKDVDDNIVFEQSLRVGGTSKVTIDIPRNVLGGFHTMIIESKYERYYKDLMILD